MNSDPYQPAKDRYINTVALLGADKAERARRGLELGIGDRGIIEAVEHPLEALSDLRDDLPESKRSAYHIVCLADRGITGPRLRTCGSKACEQFTGKELDEAPVAPKTIRSFMSAGFQPSLSEVKTLPDAGYTSGSDLKAASPVRGTTDIARLVASRKHSTGAKLAVFAAATSGKWLRPDDPKVMGRLLKLGIDDPAKLRPWTAASHNRADDLFSRDQSILAIHADVIKAGITPERLGAITRAGIPVTEAAKHKSTRELWPPAPNTGLPGMPIRPAKVERCWQNEPTPWAFSKENYLDGETK
ncbi:MAG: hypothetical protein NVSMB43_15120 [Pseudarthrobacter sp.]